MLTTATGSVNRTVLQQDGVASQDGLMPGVGLYSQKDCGVCLNLRPYTHTYTHYILIQTHT